MIRNWEDAYLPHKVPGACEGVPDVPDVPHPQKAWASVDLYLLQLFPSLSAEDLLPLKFFSLGRSLAQPDLTSASSAGEDAADGALPGSHLLPPAVLRRRPLPADERKEALLDLPRLR